jgi:hypothetical protein
MVLHPHSHTPPDFNFNAAMRRSIVERASSMSSVYTKHIILLYCNNSYRKGYVIYCKVGNESYLSERTLSKRRTTGTVKA